MPEESPWQILEILKRWYKPSAGAQDARSLSKDEVHSIIESLLVIHKSIMQRIGKSMICMAPLRLVDC